MSSFTYTHIDADLPIEELTQAQARKGTDEVRANMDTLSFKIYSLFQGKAHLALGYKSVGEWSKAEFGIGRSRVYQINAWQSLEICIKERFGLSEEWSVVEERYRGISPEMFHAIVTDIQKALNAAVAKAGKDSQPITPELVATRVINDHYAERENARKAKAGSTKTGDEKSTTKTSTTTTTTTAVQAVTVPAITYDLLKVKMGSSSVIWSKLVDDENDIDIATQFKMTQEVNETSQQLLNHLAGLLAEANGVDSTKPTDSTDVNADESADVNTDESTATATATPSTK